MAFTLIMVWVILDPVKMNYVTLPIVLEQKAIVSKKLREATAPHGPLKYLPLIQSMVGVLG